MGGNLAQAYLGLIQGAGAYSSGKAKSLTGLKVLNARTLQITITKPAAYFLVTLAWPTADVLDPSVVAGKPLGVLDPKTGIYNGNYLTTTCTGNQGAGPFQFVCRDRSSNPHSFYSSSGPMYTLVPNPYYYGRKSHLQIELPQYSADPVGGNAYKLYLAGKLDTAGIPSVFVSRWRNRSTEYHAYPSSLVTFLVPNVHLAPFDNLHCRLAVAYAIDRASLAANILHGTSRASYTVVPKGMLGFYDGKDNPHYSLSRMRAELARCPGRTVPIELKYIGGDHNVEAVGNGLIAAGMNVKPVPLSFKDWFQVVSHPLDATHTQIVGSNWQQDYPDPQDYCFILLRSGQFYNVGGWHSAAYDRLVDRADFVLDPKKRAQLYIQAQHIALSQGAMISLTNLLAPVLIKPYVHGLVGSAAPQITARNNDWANVSISKH